jgi:hypothetical protein
MSSITCSSPESISYAERQRDSSIAAPLVLHSGSIRSDVTHNTDSENFALKTSTMIRSIAEQHPDLFRYLTK